MDTRMREYGYGEYRDALLNARAEIERLEAWKADATVLLAKWDRVWEAAGRPGKLGDSKADVTLAEIERLEKKDIANEAAWDALGPALNSHIEADGMYVKSWDVMRVVNRVRRGAEDERIYPGGSHSVYVQGSEPTKTEDTDDKL